MGAECSLREGSHGSSLAEQFVRTCANLPEEANLMFDMACMRGETCVKFEQCIHMDAECSFCEGSHGSSLADQFVRACANLPEDTS